MPLLKVLQQRKNERKKNNSNDLGTALSFYKKQISNKEGVFNEIYKNQNFIGLFNLNYLQVRKKERKKEETNLFRYRRLKQ